MGTVDLGTIPALILHILSLMTLRAVPVPSRLEDAQANSTAPCSIHIPTPRLVRYMSDPLVDRKNCHIHHQNARHDGPNFSQSLQSLCINPQEPPSSQLHCRQEKPTPARNGQTSGQAAEAKIRTSRRKSLSSLEFELAAWKRGVRGISSPSSRSSRSPDSSSPVRPKRNRVSNTKPCSDFDNSTVQSSKSLLHLFCFCVIGTIAHKVRGLVQLVRRVPRKQSSPTSLHARATQDMLDAELEWKEALEHLQHALAATEIAEAKFQRAKDFLLTVQKVGSWKTD